MKDVDGQREEIGFLREKGLSAAPFITGLRHCKFERVGWVFPLYLSEGCLHESPQIRNIIIPFVELKGKKHVPANILGVMKV